MTVTFLKSEGHWSVNLGPYGSGLGSTEVVTDAVTSARSEAAFPES